MATKTIQTIPNYERLVPSKNTINELFAAKQSLGAKKKPRGEKTAR